MIINHLEQESKSTLEYVVWTLSVMLYPMALGVAFFIWGILLFG